MVQGYDPVIKGKTPLLEMNTDTLKIVEDIIKANNATDAKDVEDLVVEIMVPIIQLSLTNRTIDDQLIEFLWGLLCRGKYDMYLAIGVGVPELLTTSFIIAILIEDVGPIHRRCPTIDPHGFAAFIYTYTDKPWGLWGYMEEILE